MTWCLEWWGVEHGSLGSGNLMHNEADKVLWKRDSIGDFSVKLAYDFVSFDLSLVEKMLVCSFGDCHLIYCQHVITCSSVES